MLSQRPRCDAAPRPSARRTSAVAGPHATTAHPIEPAERRLAAQRLARLLQRDRVASVAELGADAVAAFEIGLRPAVRAALDRLADGTYGDCDRCGAPIGRARLRDVPYARRCAACQDRAERRWHGVDALIAGRVRTLVGEPQGPVPAP